MNNSVKLTSGKLNSFSTPSSTAKNSQTSVSSNDALKKQGLEKNLNWHSNNKPLDKILVEVKDVKKSYGKTEVLHGITFNIYEGERLAIIGPNGAGKTTLTEIIAGVKQKTSGEISYAFGNNKSSN